MFPPPQLEKSWQEILKEEWQKPYLAKLAQFISRERASATAIYPPKLEVFSAFEYSPYDQTHVVIIGQDPYHGKGQAHGLSFSVKEGVRMPPSLRNIFKELHDDLGIAPPPHGCLSSWARQGVLMLNAVLTVRENQPFSHANHGWEQFTDNVVATLSRRKDPVIFVLWGKAAQDKGKAIASHHFILSSPHPSPYSANNGFFGSRPFSKINDLLKRQGKAPIAWEVHYG